MDEAIRIQECAGQVWYVEVRTRGPGRDIRGPYYSREEVTEGINGAREDLIRGRERT